MENSSLNPNAPLFISLQQTFMDPPSSTDAASPAMATSDISHPFPSLQIINTCPNSAKKKGRPALPPDPDAEVVSLSPRTLLKSGPYECEICNQVFKRDWNLQMHRRRHKVPGKPVDQRGGGGKVRKRVFVCPEPSCRHHNPCHALRYLLSIKNHFRREHSSQRPWVCSRCSKGYAVQCEYKRHLETCSTRGHSCDDCGRVFSRVNNFKKHQDTCNAGAGRSRASAMTSTSPSSDIVSSPTAWPVRMLTSGVPTQPCDQTPRTQPNLELLPNVGCCQPNQRTAPSSQPNQILKELEMHNSFQDDEHIKAYVELLAASSVSSSLAIFTLLGECICDQG